MTGKILLEVITPERVVLKEEVDEVTAPGALGEFGVLPGHTPFMTLLGIGPLRYAKAKEPSSMAVAGGFAEVGPEKVVILAETAELPMEIDVERAQRALERAEAGIKGLPTDDAKFVELEAALKRALTRLSIAAGSH